MGGSADRQGRVEICINEIWGTVCDDMWSNVDAQVACRSLGFSGFGIALTSTFFNSMIIIILWHFTTGATAVSSAFFGQGSGPIFLDEVACIGSETSLLDCPNTMMHDCQHSEDAGVRCRGPREFFVIASDNTSIVFK